MVIFFSKYHIALDILSRPHGVCPWPPKPAYSPETMVPKSLLYFCRHGSGIELLPRVIAASRPWTVG